MSVLIGQTAKAGQVLVQSWTVTIEKIVRIVISRSLFKKKRDFNVNLRTEQFTSTLIDDRPKWLPKQFSINRSIFFTRKIMLVSNFKSVCFL